MQNQPPSPLDQRQRFNLFAQLDHLVKVADWLVPEVLNLRHGQEQLTNMADQLQSDLDRNTAASQAADTAIQAEIQQLKDAIAALSTNQAPTQAQLDQLNASSARLEAATAALGADDTAANPPATP